MRANCSDNTSSSMTERGRGSYNSSDRTMNSCYPYTWIIETPYQYRTALLRRRTFLQASSPTPHSILTPCLLNWSRLERRTLSHTRKEMLRAVSAGVGAWMRRQARVQLVSRSLSSDSDHMVVELLKDQHQGNGRSNRSNWLGCWM